MRYIENTVILNKTMSSRAWPGIQSIENGPRIKCGVTHTFSYDMLLTYNYPSMLKTYTKIILGIITFLWTLFGPFSVIVQPVAQQADSYIHTVWFQNNVVYADPFETSNGDNSSTTTKTVTPTDTDLAVTLESFLKVIYVLLWPALFIAGLAMDNSLVYGEIFWLDDALFKFWQIMKNFANFALGFIFIWSILKYIFDIKWGKAKNPKDIIVKLLLGAIWVNTSWFIIL